MAALPGKKLNNNQDEDNDGEHVDKYRCVRNSGNDRFTEETIQPVYGQDQDDHLKQGNLPLRRPDATRSAIPGDDRSSGPAGGRYWLR